MKTNFLFQRPAWFCLGLAASAWLVCALPSVSSAADVAAPAAAPAVVMAPAPAAAAPTPVTVNAGTVLLVRLVDPVSSKDRFAQLENRMDLGLRLQLASVIPLAPANKTP
jgi:hypothetical protein